MGLGKLMGRAHLRESHPPGQNGSLLPPTLAGIFDSRAHHPGSVVDRAGPSEQEMNRKVRMSERD